MSVEAASGSGCGPAVTVECYTEQRQPPMVTGVEVNRLSGIAMNVSWTPLNKAQAGGFILAYKITYTASSRDQVKGEAQSVVVPPNETSEVIAGLDPESGYDVTVRAVSWGGTSQREC